MSSWLSGIRAAVHPGCEAGAEPLHRADVPKAASRPLARRSCRTLGPRGESCSPRCAIFGASSCSLLEGRQCPAFGRCRTCRRLIGLSVRWRPAHGRWRKNGQANAFLASCRARDTSRSRSGWHLPGSNSARAVRPAAASGRPHRLARNAVPFVLGSGATPKCRAGKGCIGRPAKLTALRIAPVASSSCARVFAPQHCGPTRRSSGRSKSRFAPFGPPLISNVDMASFCQAQTASPLQRRSDRDPLPEGERDGALGCHP